jgi:acetyl esterase/lipase
MTLDEATAKFLSDMAAAGGKPLHEMTVEEARGMVGSLGDLFGPGPEMAQVRDTRVRASGGWVPIRILTPTENPAGIIVYYHGGGWVLGTLDGSDTLGRVLAARTSCVVVLVDYRMAPEFRFPTAVDDSWAALRWVDDNMTELAGARVPLIVCGDSAGGNLSAVMALRAKERGGPAIALQVLVYPVTDFDVNTTSYTDPENQLMLNKAAMVWFWDHYVPVETDRADPDASPLRAASFTGLPPAVVLTAEHDVLRAEGELYVALLRKADVPVQHQRFAGQMHGFFTMVNVLPGSAAGIDYVVDAVSKCLSAEGSLGRV